MSSQNPFFFTSQQYLLGLLHKCISVLNSRQSRHHYTLVKNYFCSLPRVSLVNYVVSCPTRINLLLKTSRSVYARPCPTRLYARTNETSAHHFRSNENTSSASRSALIEYIIFNFKLKHQLVKRLDIKTGAHDGPHHHSIRQLQCV